MPVFSFHECDASLTVLLIFLQASLWHPPAPGYRASTTAAFTALGNPGIFDMTGFSLINCFFVGLQSALFIGFWLLRRVFGYRAATSSPARSAGGAIPKKARTNSFKAHADAEGSAVDQSAFGIPALLYTSERPH